MPHERLQKVLSAALAGLEETGRRKGAETVIAGVLPPSGAKGPRYLLEGAGEKPFLRMNSNNYLGMSRRTEVVEAEEEAVRAFGTGPGAVRNGEVRPVVIPGGQFFKPVNIGSNTGFFACPGC